MAQPVARVSPVVGSHLTMGHLSDIRHSRRSRKELEQTERMGKQPRNRGRWPGAADHASYEAAQLLPPLPFGLHVAVHRVVGSTMVETTASFDDPHRTPEYVGRTHIQGALLDLPSYSHILAALADELHGLSRHIHSLKR